MTRTPMGPPSSPPPPSPSDIRGKEAVERVGEFGALPLYSFRYRGKEESYVGVMAQDVLAVDPGAVITGDDGFMRVDYARLGIRMIQLAEWHGSADDVRLRRAPMGPPSPPPPAESDMRLKADIVALGVMVQIAR